MDLSGSGRALKLLKLGGPKTRLQIMSALGMGDRQFGPVWLELTYHHRPLVRKRNDDTYEVTRQGEEELARQLGRPRRRP